LDIVNTAVRIIVVTFVFIGVALTLAGPKIVTGKNIASSDQPAAIESQAHKLNTSAKQSTQADPETTG